MSILNALRVSVRSYTASKMPFKFVPNLSFMFQDAGDLTCRYKAAKDAGFDAVECGFPYEVPVEQIKSAKEGAGVEQILINNYPGRSLYISLLMAYAKAWY